MTTQPAKPPRPDEATLILAKEIADDVLSSPVITEAARFQMHIHLAPGEENATFDQPERRVLRDFLGVLRNFDMRTSDVRMTRLFDIIGRVGLRPEWRPAFERLKESYAALNEPSWVPAPNDDPDWLRPRAAFGLWMYGDLIHYDYPKQLQWEQLGPIGQGFARQMAYDYMQALIAQVALMRRIITWGLEKRLVEP